MPFGTGAYQYEVIENWAKLPAGWQFGWVAAVACDSQDRVFVYSRSEHPLVVFDRDGNFLASWGEDVIEDAHGIFIDSEDNVWCTERETHCIFKFNAQGELVMTIGTPGREGAPGEPFRLPTDLAVASNGDLFISDGYDNARVHKYSAAGEHILSWGDWGEGLQPVHALPLRPPRQGRPRLGLRPHQRPHPALRHRRQLPPRSAPASSNPIPSTSTPMAKSSTSPSSNSASASGPSTASSSATGAAPSPAINPANSQPAPTASGPTPAATST